MKLVLTMSLNTNFRSSWAQKSILNLILNAGHITLNMGKIPIIMWLLVVGPYCLPNCQWVHNPKSSPSKLGSPVYSLPNKLPLKANGSSLNLYQSIFLVTSNTVAKFWIPRTNYGSELVFGIQKLVKQGL